MMVIGVVGLSMANGGWRSKISDAARNATMRPGTYPSSPTMTVAPTQPTSSRRSLSHGIDSHTDSATHASANATESANLIATGR